MSEWGHEFRRSYLEIGPFRVSLGEPCVPIIALTATATKRVREDIVKSLGLRAPRLVSGSVDRPNLQFAVIDGDKVGSSASRPT